MDGKKSGVAEESGQVLKPLVVFHLQRAVEYTPSASDIMKSHITNEYTTKQCIDFAIEGCDLCRKGINELKEIDEKDLNPFLEVYKLNLPQKLLAYEEVIEKLTSLKERTRIKFKPEVTGASIIRLICLINELSEKRMPDSFWGEIFESDSFGCTTTLIQSVRHKDQDGTRDFLNATKPYLSFNENKKKD